MKKTKVKIGFVPTREFAFSKEEAQKYKILTYEKITGFDTEVIDINDINSEGLLYDFSDIEKITKKLKDARIDGIFFPHVNFGTEHLVARVAEEIDKPVLIWGPRDETPLKNGTRLRDSQCGLFSTGKVLRRFNIPFTYIVNSRVTDMVFERGYRNFTAVCAVVNAFRKIRVLQIGLRPSDFWSVIHNEGELLERFGIQTFPITLQDVASGTKRIMKEKPPEYKKSLDYLLSTIDCSSISRESTEKIAALKTLMKEYCQREECNAVTIQCWVALQETLGIMPCISNGLLTEEGIPVICESDLHGAISSVMIQEAAMSKTPVFFTDFTNRHPDNDNAELLWHCGNLPASLAKEGVKTKAGRSLYIPPYCDGAGEWEIKGGDMTICRFDGDHGQYSMMIGEGRGVEGPTTGNTYVWFEVRDWPKWEDRMVTGPYIHHCSGVHDKVAPILYEACKYIPGLKADPFEPTEEEIKKWLRGG